MRPLLVLVTMIAVLVPLSSAPEARIQDASLCWEPDIEFPVPCDEEE